jgi:hypothetical protein
MLINDAGHWRRRAAAARALAKEMNNCGAKVAMLKIADDYERAFPMLGYSVGVHSRGVRCSSSAHFNLAIFERFRSYRRPDVRLRKG